MSFADDFFGPKIVSELLKGNVMPFDAIRNSPIIPDEKETTLTLSGHSLRTESGEVATKALTASNSEYVLVDSKNKVVPGSPNIVLESLRSLDGHTGSLKGELYNRPGIADGANKPTNIIMFFEIGRDKLFIPSEYERAESGEVTAVRGMTVRRKPASDLSM